MSNLWLKPGLSFPRLSGHTSSRVTTNNSRTPEDTWMQCGDSDFECSKTRKLFSTACRLPGSTIAIRRTSKSFDPSSALHAALDPDVASILLIHNPHRLPVAEEAGISLQISGHTHRGQFYPFTKIVSRVYGKFAYGLNRFGNLWVYTSCGAGTWGPLRCASAQSPKLS